MHSAKKAKARPKRALSRAAQEARAWPFEEARKVVDRLKKAKGGAEKTVIFETGYGPSGLPHIGTFGEVARTAMVRHAFEVLTEGRIATRLVCFSDDMDGLRKVPDNVPNQEMLRAHLDKPLSAIPDPFSDDYPSFAAHNNARLRRFLDRFGFDYEFLSATECYRAGRFDAALLKMLEVYDEVMDIILPTLGPERRSTYSPFLPISPRTGKVLQVPMIERHPQAGVVVFIDPETGEETVSPVTGGRVKAQWKADWALRWTALGVDYEMCGKDLIDSVTLSSKICRALGGTPPENFIYELFLDQNGAKISKSKGNGLTIEEWLTYASPESLSLFMFQKPRAAKRLYFDVIPKAVDEYLAYLAAYPQEEPKVQLENPVWHIHSGAPPEAELPISFALLLNLVSVSNAEDKATLWGFIRKYAAGATPEKYPILDHLVGYALAYYQDFVKPGKTYRLPNERERKALKALSGALAKAPGGASGEDLQNIVYDVGKAHAFEPLRAWFGTLYEVLLGQTQGPRFGGFIELYGVEQTRALIAKALKGELAGKA
ncbi:MAG: lysine--tRNA ligase [Hyphomicrobiaceae bacterium]|nr:lysine--tRNA ligase [Hyphomicrobiaceae bacterium]